MSSTPPLNLYEQAEAHRLLLGMGTVTVSEIVSWADSLIAFLDRPPEWLLDVSLAADADRDAMASRLRDLPCDGNPTTAAYLAFGRFAEAFRSGRIPVQQAAQMLQLWAAIANVSHDDRSHAMLPIWIAGEISCGHASEDNVRAAIDRCLDHVENVKR